MEALESEVLDQLLLRAKSLLAVIADKMLLALGILDDRAHFFLEECLFDVLLAYLAFHWERLLRSNL
jgi:hypothetical protein